MIAPWVVPQAPRVGPPTVPPTVLLLRRTSLLSQRTYSRPAEPRLCATSTPAHLPKPYQLLTSPKFPTPSGAFNDRFAKGAKIAKGGYSVVYACTDQAGASHAVKVVCTKKGIHGHAPTISVKSRRCVFSPRSFQANSGTNIEHFPRWVPGRTASKAARTRGG